MRSDLQISLRVVPKVATAAGLAGTLAFVPELNGAILAAAAAVIYLGVLALLRGIPSELWKVFAFRSFPAAQWRLALTRSSSRFAVGLNLLYLVEGSAGAGRYGLELLGALKRVEPQTRVAAFVGRDASQRLFSQPWSSRSSGFARVRITNRTHLVAQMLALPALAARRSLDVLHSPANVGPPAAPRVARVVTLLDLIWLHRREAWDASRAGRRWEHFRAARLGGRTG